MKLLKSNFLAFHNCAIVRSCLQPGSWFIVILEKSFGYCLLCFFSSLSRIAVKIIILKELSLKGEYGPKIVVYCRYVPGKSNFVWSEVFVGDNTEDVTDWLVFVY
jgi:hypothetical protein